LPLSEAGVFWPLDTRLLVLARGPKLTESRQTGYMFCSFGFAQAPSGIPGSIRRVGGPRHRAKRPQGDRGWQLAECYAPVHERHFGISLTRLCFSEPAPRRWISTAV